MKRLILLLPIILVMLTSGCSIPGFEWLTGDEVTEYEHDILVIQDLRAIPDDVSPGQEFKIISYIRNIGLETIPQEGDDGIKHVDNKIVIELYDYCRGAFEIVGTENKGMKCPGEPKIDRTSGTASCIVDKILPGQTIEVDWTLRANSDIKVKTTCPVDGMKILVRYPFKTTSLTTISVMNAQEMQRQIEEGTFQSRGSSITAGRGPIKPFITVEDQQPISQGSGSTVISLQVENKGSGFLATPITEGEDSGRSSVILNNQIEITMPPEFSIADGGDCNFQASQGTYKPKDPDGIRLIYGKSPKMFCSMAIKDNITPKEVTLHATVDVEYEYEFRDSVMVTITPKI